MADVHFCPTVESKNNLSPNPGHVYVTGNTVVDAVQALAPKNPTIVKDVLITLHRRESPWLEYGKAILALARRNREFDFRIVIHPNETGQGLEGMLENYPPLNIKTLAPMDYLVFLRYLASCYLVLTDSGGLQEEAPALNKPVVVMREKTERPEGLGLTSRLAAPDELVNITERLLYNKTEYFLTAGSKNPFGDGKASERIAEVLNA
jgi:UDP-N-acetylglucosamine 2-epimerase (non-hydrolysing)